MFVNNKEGSHERRTSRALAGIRADSVTIHGSGIEELLALSDEQIRNALNMLLMRFPPNMAIAVGVG